jgi:hypothetical protein
MDSLKKLIRRIAKAILAHPVVERIVQRIPVGTRQQLFDIGKRLVGIRPDLDDPRAGVRHLNLDVAFVDDEARRYATQAVHIVDDEGSSLGLTKEISHLDLILAPTDRAPVPERWRATGAPVVGVRGLVPPVADRVSPFGFDKREPTQFLSLVTSTRQTPVVPDTPPGRTVELLPSDRMPTLDIRPHRWRGRVQRYLGLLDHPSHHDDPWTRARFVINAAASGVPVRVTDPEGLRGLVPGPLLDEVTRTDLRTLLDRHDREVVAHRQWSLALDLCSMRATYDGILRSIGRMGLADRTISVVVATNRPEMVDVWAPQLATQTYPHVEVVAAFHGDAFDDAAEATARAWLGDRLTVVRAPGTYLLGEVLQAATLATSGDLVVKWDDDDLYSSVHLADLARTYEYSGATMVAKACEYVYLTAADVTVRRIQGYRESFSTTVAGGSLCIARGDLLDLGGWRRAPRRVDQLLIADVLEAEGHCYRASGLGYVMIRGGAEHGHTWAVGDDHFLRSTNDQRRGLDLGFAGVDLHPHLADRFGAVLAP